MLLDEKAGGIAMDYSVLKSIQRRYERIIDEIEQKMKDCPEGKLRAIAQRRQNGISIQYYRRSGKETNGVYLGKGEEKLIRDLAQKEYLLRVLRSVKKEKMLIERFLDRSDPNALTNAYTEMDSFIRELVVPFEYPDDEYVQRWQAKSYTPKPFEEGDPEIYTKKGERVRSKSEQLIADRLFFSNVPYRFEYPVTMSDGITMHTDFTVLNKKTRASIRWEHFGMMDDPDYRTTTFWKMAKYAENGYYQGKNIIYTFEDGKNPLDSRYLDRLIKKYFL